MKLFGLALFVVCGLAETNANTLEWLLGLYNPHSLVAGNFSAGNASESCGNDVNAYLTALDKEELWAAKLMDANGRYTPQLFYGNNFWLGSRALCRQLSSSHVGVNEPPFPVSFRVARLLMKMDRFTQPQGQLIFLGVCLPTSCSNGDVRHILSRGYNTTHSNASVTVLNVRSVPGGYSLLEDKKFFAFGGSVLVVAFLMLVGSLLECVLSRRNKSKMESDDVGDVENNNGNKSKGKVNVYEVNKKSESEKVHDEHKANGSQEAIVEEDKGGRGLISEFFLSFSVFANARKIMKCSSEDSLSSVHGLRFLSLAWVVMVHTYLQIFAIGANKALRSQTEKLFVYQTVGNATYSVDSFFLISGLLVSYVGFKNNGQQKTAAAEGFASMAAKFATLIAYRFIRLTPVYIIVLGLVHFTMTVLKDVTVFETPLIVDLNCDAYWWRNILYVNNLFPRREMCMLWSWYMAADTQFFVLSCLLLLLAKRYFKFSAASLVTILLSSWFTTAFISYTNQFQARVQEPFALFDELYDKPWTRIGPYLVGMCAGWYLQHFAGRIRMPVIVVLLGWSSSIACLLALVYGIQGGLDVALSSVYSALGHTAWGLALAWIVVACSSGYGGWVNSILSWRVFYPLSRLTYCAYLAHPVIMFLTNYVMDGPFHMHNAVVIIVFLGNLLASFMLSFVLSLAFEAPFVRLLKLAFSPASKRS